MKIITRKELGSLPLINRYIQAAFSDRSVTMIKIDSLVPNDAQYMDVAVCIDGIWRQRRISAPAVQRVRAY